MVGEGQRAHAQFDRPVHQPVDPAGAVEQAVVAMDVEMDEIFVGGRHGGHQPSPFWWTCKAGKKPLTDAAASGLIVGFSANFRPFPITCMSIEIKIRKNGPVDRALRRMKKKLDRENIIKGTRAKRYYEKPCEKRRRKNKVMAFTAMLRRRYAE